MAVDRGELRYTIGIQDRFTGPIRKFREELLKAQNTIKFVRESSSGFRELSRDIGAARREVRGLSQDQQRAASASQQTVQFDRERARAIQDGARQQREIERIRAAGLRDQRREQARLAAAERAAGRERTRAARESERATSRATQNTRVLNRELRATQGAGNRIAFTFRRLIGIFAAFQGVRLLAGGATGFVEQAIQFNRTIEDSEIGIASLLANLGSFRTVQGEILQGQEAFNAATGESAQIIERIRQRALATRATFEELLIAFQAGLGPGLEAGLQLDEILTVSERVSQAAAALQLPQNQLVEEIRSLLRGTAQSRTSIVASVLFGGAANANRIIRQAREAGNVFEVINERLDSFRFAANATQQTFSGLLARIRDAASVAGGTAALPFFDELKNLLGDIGELFVVIERDAEGAISNITPRPEAVALLQIVFNSLRDAVSIVREGLGGFDVDTVAAAFDGLGGIIRGVAAILVGLVQGATRGFALLSSLAERFSGAVGGIDVGLLQEVAQLVGTIGTALIGAALSGAALRGVLGLLRQPIVRFIGILGAATLATQAIGSEALGIPLSFRDAATVVQLVFEELFGRVTRFGEIAFKTFANRVVQLFTDPIGFIASALQTLLNGLGGAAAIASRLGLISETSRQSIEDSIAGLERFANARRGEDNPFLPFKPGDIDKSKAELDDFLKESQQKFDDFAADVAARDADENTKFNPVDDDGLDDAAGAVERAIRAANEALKGLIDEGLVDQNAISEAIKGAAQQADDDPNKPKFEPNSPTEEESKLKKFLDGIVENFESGLAIARGVVTSFSNFVATSIIDALDPTKDFDIKERFARFLQDIARLIIQQLVQLAIAKAVLGLGGFSDGGGVPQTSVPSFADGGDVPGRFARPSLQPSSVPLSDTVPAWLTPGEFVQPVRAVARYGMDAMEAIRRGAVDPMALRALAGLTAGKKARSIMRGGPNSGFQTGGLVTSEVERAQAIADSRAQEAEQQPPIALVVGNEQSLDRLLAGGKKAMFSFFKQNSAALDGILARNRT